MITPDEPNTIHTTESPITVDGDTAIVVMRRDPRDGVEVEPFEYGRCPGTISATPDQEQQFSSTKVPVLQFEGTEIPKPYLIQGMLGDENVV